MNMSKNIMLLTKQIIPEIETGAELQLKYDSSTNSLNQCYRKIRELLNG